MSNFYFWLLHLSDTAAVLQQMVISSLELIFEHQRSDSKFYIDYDGETVNDDSLK